MAGLAHVIMINPIHIDLPPLVCLLQATCNKFTHADVSRQLDELKELYNIYLLPVLGPFVGHSSDGDSRRRKLHLTNVTELNGKRYELEHENFTHSGKVSDNGVENLSD